MFEIIIIVTIIIIIIIMLFYINIISILFNFKTNMYIIYRNI